MTPTRAGLFMAFLLLASACAGSRSFVCPERGGPPWHEVTTEHFLVRTATHPPGAARGGHLS